MNNQIEALKKQAFELQRDELHQISSALAPGVAFYLLQQGNTTAQKVAAESARIADRLHSRLSLGDDRPQLYAVDPQQTDKGPDKEKPFRDWSAAEIAKASENVRRRSVAIYKTAPQILGALLMGEDRPLTDELIDKHAQFAAVAAEQTFVKTEEIEL